MGAIAALCGAAPAEGTLSGAGSTFVAPFFRSAFAAFALTGHGSTSVSYRSNGSGAGVSDLIARKVEFCATDVPMNAQELRAAGGDVVQFPVALGGVALTYDVPQPIAGNLHLTRQAVADMFLGKITSWNDAEIARSNPRATLPNFPITIVHRSDASGTTYIFTDFLSSVSPEWKRTVGVGKDVRWPSPRSVAASGNDGIAQTVARTPGSIGYVELTYVEASNLLTAWIGNRAGAWSFPSQQSIQAAAAAKAGVSASDFSIVDGASSDAYPIAGYSWAAVRHANAGGHDAAALRALFTWLVGPDAQRIAAGMYYVPLPAAVRETALRAIAEIGR